MFSMISTDFRGALFKICGSQCEGHAHPWDSGHRSKPLIRSDSCAKWTLQPLATLGGCISFEERSGREPKIIWEKHVHWLHRLLNEFVTDEEFSQGMSTDSACTKFDFYYYLYKQDNIDNNTAKSIFFKYATRL
eukprot:gb/GEZJ01008219.1/.p2 GENE.gb/GEZJ01008219.1/~~gb/GEZJ01008219.1/.p2  ORF type:complete len:134 (-),score=4.49 gb/GEZJ01008219.1/:1215-1616(-)